MKNLIIISILFFLLNSCQKAKEEKLFSHQTITKNSTFEVNEAYKELYFDHCLIQSLASINLAELESISISNSTYKKSLLQELINAPKLKSMSISIDDYSTIELLCDFKNLRQLIIYPKSPGYIIPPCFSNLVHLTYIETGNPFTPYEDSLLNVYLPHCERDYRFEEVK